MNLLIFLFLFVALLFILFWLSCSEAKKHDTTTAKEFAGICNIALDRTVRKNKNKVRILELLKERPELTNSDIREVLGISRRSVARYMEELEKEGGVEQVGKIGRGVVYRIKPQSEK
ncbi:MAG: winged helix-turn-helix domain-containing protein [Patescibacteria group bacterium]|nr:winged helix-turn-helix domain-containing protein [Patescibacteria group bacterium]